MQKTFIIAAVLSLLGMLPSCNRCEQCTATQGDFGEVTREICGRRAQRNQLVTELESDTIGVGPWVCE
jgi:hypothetical protein